MTQKERGQALVEFALVIPILILIFIGILDLGHGVYAYGVVSSAAREGARFGIVNPTDTSGIKTQARANTAALDPSKITVPDPTCSGTKTTCDATPGNLMTVSVSYTFTPITSFLGSFTMQGKATMTIE